MRTIRFIEVPNELGAGTRGASLGIEAIKIAGLNADNHLFKKIPSVRITPLNHLLHEDIETPHAKYVEGLVQIFKKVNRKVSHELVKGRFPIVLAGDHSTAAATISGIKTAHPDKRLGVIWIDAHADLHNAYTTPSGNVHGMPLAIATQEANPSNHRNEIVGKTKSQWKKLCNTGINGPWIRTEDIVFIGVRSTEPEEDFLIAEKQIPNHTVEQLRSRSPEIVAQESLNQLAGCDLIYISFDVDSMDCELVSRGTGTPVENGFSEQEANDLVLALLEDPRVCCLEIVEVNPTLDNKCNLMAETAFRILNNAVDKISSAISLQAGSY
jgi:arginase